MSEVWVPIPFAAEMSKRPWRTLQTWIRRGQLERRSEQDGTLTVPLYATIRLAEERKARKSLTASSQE